MNFSWLLEGRLAGSGMVFPEDLPALRRRGIAAIVSLTERNPFETGVPEGVSHLHLPVPDMTAPSLTLVRSAVEFLQEHVAAGHPALVHCGAGFGRTGTVLACYLVSYGLPAETAMRHLRQLRPGSIETEEQEEIVRAFDQALRERSADA